MSALAAFALLVLLMTILKFLNVTNPPRQPRVVSNDPKFLDIILKYCPQLREPYVPVRFWGSSGHLQTIIHATLGRSYYPVNEKVNPRREAARHPSDGANVTWDVCEPSSPSPFPEVYTIAVCPGIANSSESSYVRSLIAATCDKGYRCIVLNHIGALPHVPVTSPRVFRYGDTRDFHLMLTKFYEGHPETKFLLVGFSMGGNIVCKYLGENINRPSNILGAISICQGYDAVRSLDYLLRWHNLARLYLYSMTENMRSVILRNRDVLLSEEMKRKHNIDERKVLSSATLPELDEEYTRRIFGFRTTEELYRKDSSSNYLQNVQVPLILVNAKDDPIVHPNLLSIPETYVRNRKESVYIETEHGGHLGFYDGGFVIPNTVTWLDKAVVGLVLAISHHYNT